MRRSGCLFVLIPLTLVITPPALFYLVVGTYGMFDDWRHARMNFPLPSLAPAFVIGSLIFLVPLASLWWFYFAVIKNKVPTE